MNRYAIFAAEQLYGGLHGMCYEGVVEAKDDQDAENYAIIQSCEVIDSYDCIREELKNENGEVGLCEINDDILFNYARVDESKVHGMTTSELDELCYDIGYDEFSTLYCVPDVLEF